jgi:hypothetical protein
MERTVLLVASEVFATFAGTPPLPGRRAETIIIKTL